MSITSRFSANKPISCAQGRYGDLIIVQGGGVRPARWTGGSTASDAGMDAPTTPPSILVGSAVKYYVARVDVNKGGACYNAPPVVSFSGSQSAGGTVNYGGGGANPFLTINLGTTPPPRGASEPYATSRPATALSYLSQASVAEIRVTDSGKYYSTPPAVSLSATHGTGAVLEAVLDAPGSANDPNNNPKTGITQWEIIQAPPYNEGGADDKTIWYRAFNGRSEVSATNNATLPKPDSGYFFPYGITNWDASINCNATTALGPAQLAVSGTGNGVNARIRLTFAGAQWACTGSYTWYRGARQLLSASPAQFGSGYDDNTTVVVRIRRGNEQSSNSAKDIVLHGYTSGNPNNTDAPGYSIKAINIVNGGSGYLVAPQLKFVSTSGFGAYATCTVTNGVITAVKLESGGGGYKTAPTIEVVSGGAEAFAVARPHLRGKYQCYYRYVDSTPTSSGGPIPSVLSPVREVDTGNGSEYISWTVPPPSGRATHVELWRSTGNQAITLYRVATFNVSDVQGSQGLVRLDDLTDDELRDPNRTHYAAMPIVLPNGELNAMRFVVPPSDKAAVVRFQDRFWYGVDTSGAAPNSILYSEVDEPESVPNTNEIVLQTNARDADQVQALIPFGSTLLIMQARHAYALTFARNPFLDAQVTPIAFRGCLNQRCWDIHNGVCYVLDQYGVYAITPGGEIDPISDPIDDAFRSQIDFGKTTWPFVVVDAKTKTVRAFVAYKGDGASGYPSRVLCYCIQTKSWYVERYPHRISCGVQSLLANGDLRCVYGGDGGMFLLNEGRTDLARGAVVSVLLTSGGSGYKRPPKVTASGGTGAEFAAILNSQGRVASIWVANPGHGYTSGSLAITAPEDGAGSAATATFVATSNAADTSMFPVFRLRTGSAEYTTDADRPKGGMGQARDVSVSYRPQPASCELVLRMYYNQATFPRPASARRDRGRGFSFSPIDSGCRHDLGASTAKHASDDGVATALFASRTNEDVSGDRSVAVEIIGARKNAEPVVIYDIEIKGVEGKNV